MNAKAYKEQLLAQYPYRIELHAHTRPVSNCSEVEPKEMARIYADLGYDALVLANHFQYQYDYCTKDEYLDKFLRHYEETKAYGEECGLKVFLCAEARFTTSPNDYLFYGVDRAILSEIYDHLDGDLAGLRESCVLPDTIVVQAHPKRNGMDDVDLTLLDGVEVFNLHPGHNSRVGLASVLAADAKLPIVTAGTDFHHLNCGHEGLSAMRTAYMPKDGFELVEILRSGDYLLEVGRSNLVLP